jgi:PBP4 family serine-type D-alanyl-D-alanine carboxypeptidase
MSKLIWSLLICLMLVGCDSTNDGFIQTDTTGTAPPQSILDIMNRPRYAEATWSLLVVDLDSGQTYYELNPDLLSFTGSARKLFSVGALLNAVGAGHRQSTAVHRQGTVTAGVLNGDLILVAGGDLTFGGRRIDANTIQVTDVDHNSANGPGTAILTPQDPLFGLQQLAAQVKAAGIDSVTGQVVVDDRLFETYRVPNGNVLTTPMYLNENLIDVTVTPTQAGQAAGLVYRPQTGFFDVVNQVMTGIAGSELTVAFSGDGLTSGVGDTGTVTGEIPIDHVAPITGLNSFVGTYRVEDPNSFARTAFIEALQAQGVAIAAATVEVNPEAILPVNFNYDASTQVADFLSVPYSEHARLILKVSLNQGANLSLSLFGIQNGQRTVQGALAIERETLVNVFGLAPDSFDFPSNGSGSPDSQATPRALVEMLTAMSKTANAGPYREALPILGVDGTLAHTGQTLPALGQVFAKTGTTVSPDENNELEIKAKTLAGYVDTAGGRRVVFALIMNDGGPLTNLVADLEEVLEDQAEISNEIFELL